MDDVVSPEQLDRLRISFQPVGIANQVFGKDLR
jgi:hypothetical protein